MKRMEALFRRLKDFRRYKDSMIYDRHRSALSYVLRYLRYSLRCRYGRTIKSGGTERATAILVSYKREHNMEPLVRCCLRCGWINRVIVLNNNPAIRIADWIGLHDPRITLIDEGVNKGAMQRYVVAAHSDAANFLSVDDDIFLTPEQLTALFRHLVADPSVPHGMFGQHWLGVNHAKPMHSFQNCVVETDGEVDILNRVYFFTKAHAVECLNLAQEAGFTTPEALMTLSSVDDVFLAFSGQGRPQIHNVGPFMDCPTQAEPGTAQWTEGNFWKTRIDLYQALASKKSRGLIQ